MGIKEAIKFEQDLYNLINTCGLSVDTAFYILKSVYLDFQKTLLNCAENEGDTFTQEEKTYDFYKDNKEITENDDTVNRDNA